MLNYLIQLEELDENNVTTQETEPNDFRVCFWVQESDSYDQTDNISILLRTYAKVIIESSFIDWGSSWSGMWNYKVEWFQWSGSQHFSLMQMKCVDLCLDGEVLMESPNLHGLSVWRNLNYYVYPSSDSVLELGTFENPYKSINHVIIEMFNFADTSDKNVSVNLSLGDSHYLVSYSLYYD